MVGDEVGSSLKAVRGLTWAKKGITPVLEAQFNWDKLSIIGGMTPEGRVLHNTYPHSIKSVQVVAFLKHLLTHLEGPVVLLLDGARIHHAKVVKAFLAPSVGQRITLFHFPGYAPECNPIEWLWAWVKTQFIANLCPKNLTQLKAAWSRAFAQFRNRPELAQAFFDASTLPDFVSLCRRQ